ncbi:hypothetical protein EHQ53_16180 [Leptospira langatensis]|uniref:Uncharacterized protein n=1 Tax=Leptospira langatensis TaxID=2484983 RepID=A0A5F1ZNB3_9LEPT|nr:hypothetical protein [Leptospira langatensis]TGK05182.1 hypothetical protein EHO57_00425 [Leptospira langatensis]TGL38318.1 hypothetical protein EHQ53_16180 [Leptospira langatensis]
MSRTKKKSDQASSVGVPTYKQGSREWDRLELYLRGMGLEDSLEIRDILINVFEKYKVEGVSLFETFEQEISLKLNRDLETSLPAMEPGSMVPRPIDFGPLADLASPSAEKPEPVALVLTALFWAAVYISLAFWYFS